MPRVAGESIHSRLYIHIHTHSQFSTISLIHNPSFRFSESLVDNSDSNLWMALVREIVCASLVKKSCVNLSSRSEFYNGFGLNQGCDQFAVKSIRGVRRFGKRNGRLKVGVVAAISEDLVRIVAAEKSVTFKVRAVVTVKNKSKEDMKETLAKHLDNFTEKFGRNVALELVSTEVDQSMYANCLLNCLNEMLSIAFVKFCVKC